MSGDALTAPMRGTIVKIAAAEGQTGEPVAVLEAMTMERSINAHKPVTGIVAAVP
ncbi:hypothetical protein [Microbispora sp. H11081]|uniref:hypothetical protein n=1 Tax=Microbispora sp. H11081 TaxID=2729107 RepID=UPI0014756A2F|nr:hypothetical protein [Microbispora sp. H11081]